MNRFPPCLVVSLLMLAAITSAAADRDEWHLEYGRPRKMQVTCVLSFSSPEGKINDCEYYAAFPPDFGHQHPNHCNLYANGQLIPYQSIVEESSYHRSILQARIPGSFSSNHTNLLTSLDYEITLVGRHLKPGPATEPPPSPQTGELELALKETHGLDFRSPVFASWLAQQGLSRNPGETAITFAKRACDFAGNRFTYLYPPKRAKVSIACNFTEGDCGSYSQLFIAICRANGIPARSLTGFWVNPSHGIHQKSEFYAAGVGWVPVDAGRHLFGEEEFQFVAMIVGDELPTWHLLRGGAATSYMQSPLVFAIGGAGANASKKDWVVAKEIVYERVPRPAKNKLAPLPDVFLGDLSAMKVTIGWGKLGAHQSVGGNPLAIDGWQFDHGIGTHAHSELVYDLRPEYQRFVAVVGVDDEMSADSPASVVFKVFFDDQLAKETHLIRPNQAVPLSLPIPKGSSRIRLVVTDGGDGANSDHADWCHAGFITGTATKETKVDSAERLKEIKDQFDKGIISQETYDQKRTEILDSL